MSDNYSLHYMITEKELYKKQNHQNYEQIKKLLEEVGVILDVDDGKLSLSIFQDTYNEIRKRNAGRRRNIIFRDENHDYDHRYTFADIIYMSQSMTDKEICEKIGIPQATFYRHKKRLKDSSYFKSLDRNRLNDMEYLQSVDGNLSF